MPEVSYMGNSAITLCPYCKKLFIVNRCEVRAGTDKAVANMWRHVALSPKCRDAKRQHDHELTEIDARWKAESALRRAQESANPTPPPVQIDVSVRFRISMAKAKFDELASDAMKAALFVGPWEAAEEASAAEVIAAEIAHD